MSPFTMLQGRTGGCGCPVSARSRPVGIITLLLGLSVVVGLVFSIVAIVQIRRSEGRLRGMGLAVAGLLAGGATTLFFFFSPELKPIAMHEGLFGLVVHVPVLLIVSLLTTAQDPARVEAYINPPATGS